MTVAMARPEAAPKVRRVEVRILSEDEVQVGSECM